MAEKTANVICRMFLFILFFPFMFCFLLVTWILVLSLYAPFFLLRFLFRHFEGLLAGVVRSNPLLQAVLACAEALGGIERDRRRFQQPFPQGMRIRRRPEFRAIEQT